MGNNNQKNKKSMAQTLADKNISFYLQLKETDPKKQMKAKNVFGADGFIIGDSIVINKDIAGRTGAINVGAHEVLHGVLAKHMKSLGEKGRIKLGKSFMGVLTKTQDEAVRKRLRENYKLEGDAVFSSEEIFTAFSDAIKAKEITFDESVFDKIKNLIQEVLRTFGINKDFSNGRQAYNFLKDYSQSVEKNQLSSRALKLAEGGTTAVEGMASISQTNAINQLGKVDKDGNDLEAENGNFLYQAEADDIVKEITEKGYLDNLIAAKYKGEVVPPNFVKQVMSELSQHIKAYKPERKNESGLFGWINPQISNKATAVYNREYKGDEAIRGAKDLGETT